MWGAAANNHSYSRKYMFFSTKPRRFTTVWVSEAVRTIRGILLYVPWLRKKTENKKCKILDKRCFNVQRHHPNRRYHLLDLKTCQKHKDFALISGQVGDISDLSDVSARWSTVCQKFYIFYFRVFSWAKIHIKGCQELCVRLLTPSLLQNGEVWLKKPSIFWNNYDY